MKNVRNLTNGFLIITIVIFTSGCAAGAATAGFALRSSTADSLSAEAEHRIVERTKKEVLSEISQKN